MATEETAGGARKATKSKLFEFLVHGVVSGAVRHSRERAPACIRACARVGMRESVQRRRRRWRWQRRADSERGRARLEPGHVKVISSLPGYQPG